MHLDLIRKARQAFPRSKTGNGATNLQNGVIHIDLDRTWLLEKLAVVVTVTQGFTGAPTSSDVRRFFSQMQILVDQGNGMKANFAAAYDLFRLLKPQAPAPVVVLGAASSATFTFEINFAQLLAIGSLSTALLSGRYATLALELTVAPDANNGFIGGTVPQVAQYSVECMPFEMRDQTPASRGDQGSGWGVAERVLKQQANLPITQNGGEFDIILSSGGKTRFVVMHCFDAATYGNLTDAIINNGARLSMELDGFKHYENTLLSAVKLVNIQDRGAMPATGVVLMDFGDDPKQWADMRRAKDIKFHLSVPASANLPASGRIEICQDYTVGLERLRGALAA